MYACNPEAEELETESSGSCWLANLTKSSSSTFMDRPYLKKKNEMWVIKTPVSAIYTHSPHMSIYIYKYKHFYMSSPKELQNYNS